MDRREWNDFPPVERQTQIEVGYGYMFRLVQFLRKHNGKLVEILDDDELYEAKLGVVNWQHED